MIPELLFLLLNGTALMTDNNYISPLLWSCKEGKVGYVYQLLNLGADITVFNNACIKYASKYNHFYTVRLSHYRGGDIHVNDEYPLLKAVNNRNAEMVEFLLENGADMYARDLTKLVVKDARIFSLFEQYGLKQSDLEKSKIVEIEFDEVKRFKRFGSLFFSGADL